MTTDRRTVTKGLVWAVPAVVVAGAAPAFAASPTDPSPGCTPSPAETTTVAINLRAGGSQGVTLGGSAVRSADGINFIGGGNGTATIAFELPATFEQYGAPEILIAYGGSLSNRLDYVLNGIAGTLTTSGGDGTPVANPPTYALNAANLQAGPNTVTFGNPSQVSAGYITDLTVTYVSAPAVECP